MLSTFINIYQHYMTPKAEEPHLATWVPGRKHRVSMHVSTLCASYASVVSSYIAVLNLLVHNI